MPLTEQNQNQTREVAGTCKLCAAACTMRFTKDASGRIVKARGDYNHPISHGYACSKGLRLHESHYSPERILFPLKRMSDGRFERVSASEALDEIAHRLQALIERHGADSIGVYRGTFGYDNPLFQSLLKAIGSKSFFSSLTIDQSSKVVTAGRMGSWDAGKDQIHDADVILLAGTNPLVSNTTFNLPSQNPLRHIRIARARGMKLIVIDPRRTETAAQADLFIQPLPGFDVVVYAGILREVFQNGWTDRAFCDRHVSGLDALRDAVMPFTPDLVANRAGISPDDIRNAAHMFAGPLDGDGATRRKRGAALTGTGPSMGPGSNLAEHLLECINVLCGRFARPGDLVANPGVFSRRRKYLAQVIPPSRPWESGWISEATGYGMFLGEKMTGTLADEILIPSRDQVRALICDSGNPANAVPDQRRIVEALRSLDLLVSIDPFMSNTARLSHFILPPPMLLERYAVGNASFEQVMTPWPISCFAPPVIEQPADSDLLAPWEVAFELAQRLGVELELSGRPMDMTHRPSELSMLRQTFRESRIPLDRIMARPPGHVFDDETFHVEPGESRSEARFELAPEDVTAELRSFLPEPATPAGYTHRLAVRRMREVLNTVLHYPSARQRHSYNPACLNPAELERLGLADGDRARLVSPYGSANVRVAGDPSLREGVVSLSHGWGGLPGENNGDEVGTNSNLLTDSALTRDPINAMPILTGVPLRIEVPVTES